MSTVKNVRRHRRIPYQGPIRISWEEQGQACFAIAKGLDISEDGLRIESPRTVPRGASIQLAAEDIKLAGAATVKYSVRRGSKYFIGLQLSQTLLDKTLVTLQSRALTAIS